MDPPPGERKVGFVGDYIKFRLQIENGDELKPGWRAFLRTNLGRASISRKEIINAHFKKIPLFGASWHDVPMKAGKKEWLVEIPLTEVGFFKAKAYATDERGWQHWPEGPDFGINIHPNKCRTGNIIYCAFTRLFGRTKYLERARDEKTEDHLRHLDRQGYTVIPQSGKLRDLKCELPHIMGTLGCKIIQLLPITPVPTTYARFGRFGSPYAALDLTEIDPALVEFDKKTTAVDQFKELTYEVHKYGGLVFLDVVINHTGWGSFLQNNFPQWFKRLPDGTFESPGAWGNIWADLVELDQKYPQLWEHFAETFLTWCRRGVDGFRCDAGYKIPVNVWQYIVARVQEEFPDTVFFLEGLGGAWEATEELVTEGGMQWAYSELFQNYSPTDISGYLDHALKQSARVGTLIHYSETHDNNRLAAKGKEWSLLRNRLCALTSVCGGFGFTCGVEWLATEKIDVHHTSGLRWGAKENIISELAKLHSLLKTHPCFFDGAKLFRLSPPDSFIFALLRISGEGKDVVLFLINTDLNLQRNLVLSLNELQKIHPSIKSVFFSPKNLVGNNLPQIDISSDSKVNIIMNPGEMVCLSDSVMPNGIYGNNYRNLRDCAAFAFDSMRKIIPPEKIGFYNWETIGYEVYKDPVGFLSRLKVSNSGKSEIIETLSNDIYPQVVEWQTRDVSRILLVPARHWLLLRDCSPFRATVQFADKTFNLSSVETSYGFIAAVPPQNCLCDGTVKLERYDAQPTFVEGKIRFLSEQVLLEKGEIMPSPTSVALMTNGIGGMARICVNLGEVTSKYDCVLGANLHPEYPVDRHIFIKRIRLWINADGFLSPLNYDNLVGFTPGNAPVWRFIANAGDGRAVEICVKAYMVSNKNNVVFKIWRSSHRVEIGKELPQQSDVRLTVRFDIEDRNFHCETKRNGGAEYHFSSNCRPAIFEIEKRICSGFEFTPSPERQLRVASSDGIYHPSPEWSMNIAHPVEATRGMVASGDAYSPGWFEIPLLPEKPISLIASAEKTDSFSGVFLESEKEELTPHIGDRIKSSLNSFIVRRGSGKTIIAGYPWFLDWGRDTLICTRGLLAAGMTDIVRDILITFARIEDRGTLPNALYGDNTANRDTSDAPLWFALACEELALIETKGKNISDAPLYQTRIDGNRRLIDVLVSIADNYIKGTPNKVKMDQESALVFSPSHFTWMDTNYPACTPREGYPVEIQALWIRFLKHLHKIEAKSVSEKWDTLIQRSMSSFNELFWLEDKGWFCDVLECPQGISAFEAIKNRLLRSNCLLPICLDVVGGLNARKCVDAAKNYLLVPGALRSLAPLKADSPLVIKAPDGRLLNNPSYPYWGRYEGDEDTRRKPAYHNGTAWVYTFPHFCEALVKAYKNQDAIKAAKSYLCSAKSLMEEGCLNHLPEILDGDEPHTQRGCDAQAWSSSEYFRVLKYLDNVSGIDG